MSGYAKLQAEVRSTVSALGKGLHKLSFTADGSDFAFNLRRQPGARTLIIHFHGAVNREQRKVPFFPSFVPDLADAHQISVPDPSMSLLDRPFNISWYAGHEGFDTQAVFDNVFAAAAEALGVERIIYFGNSGGGFAALYYSHRHPGSFALVGNPQTDILAHRAEAVSRYLAHCWPSLPGPAHLGEVVCTDLPALYRQGFGNTVIYVQSLGDRTHYVKQMLPFAGAIAQTPTANRFLLQCEFNGNLGHVAAPQDYIGWMKAIIRSPTTDITELLTTFHDSRSATVADPGCGAGATGTAPACRRS